MSYDNLCKYLAEQYPHHFASWLLGEAISDPTQIEVLKTELSNEPIRADALFLLRQQNFILHLEFQTTALSRPPLPLRMLDYWVRLHREYELPIHQFVIFLRETKEDLLNEFRAQNTWHRYNVIKLWEQDKQPLLANLGLLPFAPLAKSDKPDELLQEIAQQTAQLPRGQEKSSLLMYTALMAGLRFNMEMVMNALREDILEESSVYQEIIRRGLQQGMQQGMQQGVHAGKTETLLHILKHRFADLAAASEQQINALSSEQLDNLSLAVLDFQQLSDLENWLAQNSYQM